VHIANIDGAPLILVQNGWRGGLVHEFRRNRPPRRCACLATHGRSLKYVIEPENHRVDFKTYEFIGFQPGNAAHTCARISRLNRRAPTSSRRTVVRAGSWSNPKDLLIRATPCSACRIDT
jgi:hypothetical protein